MKTNKVHKIVFQEKQSRKVIVSMIETKKIFITNKLKRHRCLWWYSSKEDHNKYRKFHWKNKFNKVFLINKVNHQRVADEEILSSIFKYIHFHSQFSLFTPYLML
jgi:hypothetical protein